MEQSWEGANPQRFKGGKRIVGQRPYPDQSGLNLIGETSTGVEAIKEKHHYPVVSKTTREWRPSLKKAEPESVPERPRGLGIPSKVVTEAHPRPERRHIQFQPSASNKPEFPTHLKMVYTLMGKRVNEVQSEEYDLHKQFIGRKIRVPELLDKRNHLSYRALGDKYYKSVERSDNFYMEGGLIPGSTIKYRHPHQGKHSNTDFDTVLSYEATNPSRTKWNDRVRNERFSDENHAVSSLVQWEKHVLLEANPKLVDPDLTDED